MGMLERAITAVAELPGIALLATSRVYESPALVTPGPPQPDYLNAALLLHTAIPLTTLLDHTLAIEASLGRVRDAQAERWSARTIDIDILWEDGPPIVSERLVVPHLHLFERTFALAPLLDVLDDAPPRFHEHLRDRGGPPSIVSRALHVMPK